MLPRPAPTVVLLALGLGLGARDARAVDTTSAPADACAKGQGSLFTIGCKLAQALPASAAGAEVVVVELKTDRELPAADQLRQRLGQTVRSALAGATPVAGNAPSKVRVEIRIEKSAGELRVSADLTRPTGFWQRLRKQAPRAVAHAFVAVPIDAELRSLIPPPPLVVGQVVKLKAPERGIVALACGALGSDGGQELALVSRSHVRVGRIMVNKAAASGPKSKAGAFSFEERAKVAWSALSPVAPAPLREPIATAQITPQGRLRVGSSDRRDGVELDGALAVTARFSGLLPAPGGGCVTPSGVGFAGKLVPCSAGEPTEPASLGALIDALAGGSGLSLGRELGTGKLRLPSGALASPARVGAQLAVGDADGDGNAELAYSADVLEPARDVLTLVSFVANKPSKRFELPAPGIAALAICARQEGPAMAPLVVASGDELWLVR